MCDPNVVQLATDLFNAHQDIFILKAIIFSFFILFGLLIIALFDYVRESHK